LARRSSSGSASADSGLAMTVILPITAPAALTVS
jgi:hypothetical protein